MKRLTQEYLGQYGEFFQNEAKKGLARDLKQIKYLENGAICWHNGNTIPSDILELLLISNNITEAQYKASVEYKEKKDSENIAEYRKQQANHKPSQEELFEMISAFGKGTVVVDVITGKEFKL